MVIIHSESVLVGLALIVSIAVVLLLLLSAALAIGRNFGLAKRIALTTLKGLVVWVVIADLISLLTPRTIVNVGETYCMDIDCLGIDEVVTQAQTSNTTYKLNAHVFNDANTIKISFKGYSMVLMDEHGRRFPLVSDASAPPYDSLLDPGQSAKTTLTFKVAPDVQHLFLNVEDTGPHESAGGKKPPLWLQPVLPLVGLAIYGGGGELMHKQASLRVL